MMEDPRQRAAPGPALKTPMTGLIGRVPIRQILPRRARAHHPENASQDVARVAPRSPATIRTGARLRHDGGKARPLGVGAVHESPPRGESPVVPSQTTHLTPQLPFTRWLPVGRLHQAPLCGCVPRAA